VKTLAGGYGKKNLALRHPEVTLANDSPEARDRILRIPRIFLNYTPENGEKQQRKQRKRAKPEVSQTKTKAGVGTRSYFDNQLFFRFL
ncbi:MAG: hypothetical protein J5648_03070, partial [Lachnospiraceae bacterium]|nr:hypothetical protein [Lachnospiraceae bacterium]